MLWHKYQSVMRISVMTRSYAMWWFWLFLCLPGVVHYCAARAHFKMAFMRQKHALITRLCMTCECITLNRGMSSNRQQSLGSWHLLFSNMLEGFDSSKSLYSLSLFRFQWRIQNVLTVVRATFRRHIVVAISQSERVAVFCLKAC